MPLDKARTPVFRQILALLLSLICSTAAMLAWYIYGERLADVVRLGLLVVAAFAVGLAQGRLLGAACAWPIGVGAFIGLLVLWIPPTLVSYGFALLFVPVLGLIASVVGYGAACSRRLRRADAGPGGQ